MMTEVFFEHSLKPFTTHHQTAVQYCAVFGDQRIGYVSIPRCSSKVYRSELYGNNQQNHLAEKCDIWFAVIRDPITRLLSGLAECERRTLNSNRSVNEQMEMLLADPSQFDEHVETQAYFLTKATKPPVLFNFYHQHNQIPEYFKEHPMFVRRLRHLQAQQPKPIPNNIDQQLLDQCIQKYYVCDVKLWETVCN